MAVWMTSQEAADALGVKLETLYAYVSRGMVARRRGPDGRSSYFDRGDVEALARRARSGGRAGALEVAVRSNLTLIDGERVFYRGVDTSTLASTVTFESAASWLWTGQWDAGPPWKAAEAAVALGRSASALLPSSAHLADHLRVIVAAVAAADELRFDLRPEAVVASARGLMAALVDALEVRGRSRPARLVLAGDRSVPDALACRLWPRLTGAPGTPGLVHALNGVMVLLADHELAASTFAARIAASTRADPYAVVSAGMGVIAGPLHGSASTAVYELLDDAAARDPESAVARVMRHGGRLPGFGHPLYPAGDPRARRIFELLRSAGLHRSRLEVAEEVLVAAGRRAPVAPNVDFAVATLAFATGMPPDAGEAIFAISRTAGWIAHALEEYAAAPVRFRPRAIYGGAPTQG